MKNQIHQDIIDDFAASALSGMMVNWRMGGPLKLKEVARISYEAAWEMAKARDAFIAQHTEDVIQNEDEPFEDDESNEPDDLE